MYLMKVRTSLYLTVDTMNKVAAIAKAEKRSVSEQVDFFLEKDVDYYGDVQGESLKTFVEKSRKS